MSCNEGCSREEGPEDDELVSRPQEDEVQIEPCDSISNVTSNTSSKQSRSTASLQRQVEAEQAAIMACAAALRKKHALEEQAAQLRWKQEQLEIETQLVESAAKLMELKTSPRSSVTSEHRKRSHGMSSYFKLNPQAKQFIPAPKMEPSIQAQPQQSTTTQTQQVDAHPSAHASPSQGNSELYSLLLKQNEITALLAQTQSFRFLPRREVPSLMEILYISERS